MPKMIVSIDEVVIKEVQLTKDRTTLGRRPYNDIVIDNLAVSGEHAVLLMTGGQVFLEDLNSTNGTYVNGKAVKKTPLNHGDGIEIGKYKIKFVGDGAATEDFDKTMVVRTRPAVPAQAARIRIPHCRRRIYRLGCVPRCHQSAVWRSVWARSTFDQSRDHHWQTRRRCCSHYASATRFRRAPR